LNQQALVFIIRIHPISLKLIQHIISFVILSKNSHIQ
jgi:hypothetical protein